MMPHRAWPDLVLLPGLDGTGNLFTPLTDLDWPHPPPAVVRYPHTQPLSYSELEERVRASLPAEGDFVVIAESFSGPLAVALAASPPPGMRGLLLVATFASRPRRGPVWLARLLLPLLFRIPLPARLLALPLLGPGADSDLVQTLARAVGSVPPTILADRVVSVLTTDAREQAARINMPVAYLQATRDRVVPARCGAEIAALIPELVRYEVDGPHLVLQRSPSAAAEAIQRFLDEHVLFEADRP